jgi:predicted metal-dependent hydrolase
MVTLRIDDLDIEVTRKAIRTLRMRICPPEAVVKISAPLYAADADIVRFVTARKDWIRRHRESIRATPQPAPRRYVDGGTFMLWGKRRDLRVVEGRPYGLAVDGTRLVLGVPSAAGDGQRGKIADHALRAMLSEPLIALAERWSANMGLPAPEVRLRRMKTRWGSCNPRRRRIWINLELVHRPPACLEYVIVHELAHLLEPAHSARFWAIVERCLPDWRARRGQLRLFQA